MIPKKIYLNYVNDSDFENDVEITWSETPIDVSDCEMMNREYTDLSQVWHDASEEPKKGELILVKVVNTIPEKNEVRYFVEYVEEWIVGLMKTEGFKCHWAYISDLLPKGGTQ